MTEIKELVVTRTYTVTDIITLLGENKKNVKVNVGINTQNSGTRWIWSGTKEAEILKIEIREPVLKEIK